MERLQKILAAAGQGSRRECEELIRQGRVAVDGEIVTETGIKVDIEKQSITCDGEVVKPAKRRCYLFYKPKHCVCTNAPGEDSRVIDFFHAISARLFTVGRLDKESEGVILVTNDGELAQKLAHPRYEIEKVYHIVVRGRVTPNVLDQVREGVWTSEGKIVPENIELLKASAASSSLKITLKEGKNRAIRRIFAKVEHPLSRLTRIRFGPFEMGDLKPGQYRPIPEDEIQKILDQAKARPKKRVKRTQAKEASLPQNPDSEKNSKKTIIKP